MWWFELLFPLGLILMPLVYALGFELFTTAQATRSGRPFSLILWLGTAAGIGAFHLAREYWPDSAGFMWVLCFPLWFGAAMPMLAKKYPSLGGPFAPGMPLRSASLTPREQVIPRWAWWPVGLIWLVALGLISWPGMNVTSGRTWWLLVGMHLMLGALFLILTPWCLRRLPHEPEPMDPAGSAELVEGYRRLRHFRAWGLFGLSAVMLLIFSAFMVTVAWGIAGPEMGIAGGVLGTVIGLGGAVFGTIAGMRRARLNQRCQELSREPAGATREE